MPNDLAIVQYIIITIADVIGAYLMGWWIYNLRKVKKDVSVFYIILFVLFVGGVFHHSLNAYSRFLYCIDGYEESRCLRGSLFWSLRLLPDTIAKITVVGVMLHRCLILRGKK